MTLKGRPTQKKADIKAMKKLERRTRSSLDNKAIIALTMRYCGCTFTEIAQVFNIERQSAEYIIKEAESKL